MPEQLQIHIEAVQWTPGLEPVIAHYAGLGVTSGPFMKTTQHHTTQKLLADRSGTTGYWGDKEICDSVRDELVSQGIPCTVVLPEPPKPKEEEAKDV